MGLSIGGLRNIGQSFLPKPVRDAVGKKVRSDLTLTSQLLKQGLETTANVLNGASTFTQKANKIVLSPQGGRKEEALNLVGETTGDAIKGALRAFGQAAANTIKLGEQARKDVEALKEAWNEGGQSSQVETNTAKQETTDEAVVEGNNAQILVTKKQIDEIKPFKIGDEYSIGDITGKIIGISKSPFYGKKGKYYGEFCGTNPAFQDENGFLVKVSTETEGKYLQKVDRMVAFIKSVLKRDPSAKEIVIGLQGTAVNDDLFEIGGSANKLSMEGIEKKYLIKKIFGRKVVKRINLQELVLKRLEENRVKLPKGLELIFENDMFSFSSLRPSSQSLKILFPDDQTTQEILFNIENGEISHGVGVNGTGTGFGKGKELGHKRIGNGFNIFLSNLKEYSDYSIQKLWYNALQKHKKNLSTPEVEHFAAPGQEGSDPSNLTVPLRFFMENNTVLAQVISKKPEEITMKDIFTMDTQRLGIQGKKIEELRELILQTSAFAFSDMFGAVSPEDPWTQRFGQDHTPIDSKKPLIVTLLKSGIGNLKNPQHLKTYTKAFREGLEANGFSQEVTRMSGIALPAD